MIHIIDTFKDFKNNFQHNLDLSIEDKIQLWESNYIRNYPELEYICKDDFESNGYSWRDIAANMVFNRTKDDFSKMLEAYDNILYAINNITSKVQQVFHIEIDINIVLYSGLCNSAGWVTRYAGKRAVLFGIDKIAKLGWHTLDKIEPLIAHELCHVIHFAIRGEDDLNISIERNTFNKGLWSIYEEGFAQF